MDDQASLFSRLWLCLPGFFSGLLIVTSHFVASWLFSPMTSVKFRIGNPIRTPSKFDENEFVKVRSRIDAIWNRIESHLIEHSEIELQLLNDGAQLVEIESLEQKLGFHLPYDIRASLLRHDGSSHTRVPCNLFILYSVHDITKDFEFDMEQLIELSQYNIRYWSVAEGAPWPSHIVIGNTGIEWAVTANFETSEIYLRSQDATKISSSWEEVLIHWLEALEKREYEIQEDGSILFHDTWAGLNPW